MRTYAELEAAVRGVEFGQQSNALKKLIASELLNSGSREAFDEGFERLTDKQRKLLLSTAHFYYFVVGPTASVEAEPREEVRLVAIAALMEALMSEVDFVEFIDWFREEYKALQISGGPLPAYDSVTARYFAAYGTKRKFSEYLNRFFTEADKDALAERFIIHENALDSSIPKTEEQREGRPATLPEVVKYLYDVRSKFVHAAKMSGFSPEGGIFMREYKEKHIVSIQYLSVIEFMQMFERSYRQYWKELIESHETV